MFLRLVAMIGKRAHRALSQLAITTLHSWDTNLAVSASAAFLALLDGIVGRFTGDTDDPGTLR
jgi:hypothetical protein